MLVVVCATADELVLTGGGVVAVSGAAGLVTDWGELGAVSRVFEGVCLVGVVMKIDPDVETEPVSKGEAFDIFRQLVCPWHACVAN